MTDPRRPDDTRLSTADLAAATDRPVERDVTREVQQGHANVVADAARPAEDASGDHRATPLFAGNESEEFRRRWTDIQAAFVDEPRSAVKSADSLVGDVLKSLSETFSNERSRLEGQWDREGDITTEDFRVALRRYRTFFDRLLSL